MVYRAYEHQYVGVDESMWFTVLDACSAVGLVIEKESWSWDSTLEEVVIGNGFLELVDPHNIDRGILYTAYEDALEMLKLLWSDHKLFLSDLREKNLVLVQANGTVRLVMCDGKLGGATHDPYIAWKRLGVKLHYADNMHPYHVWLLQEYQWYVSQL